MGHYLTHRVLPCLQAFLSLVIVTSVAHADTATLTVTNATKGTSSTPVTMWFPVTRSGDLSNTAVLAYHTVDGTAVAGTDYIAASGQVVIPAGADSATIPVTIIANTNTAIQADLDFQLQLDGATGAGPTPAFTTEQPFASGNYPRSVTFADINRDGKPDLIVANESDGTVSVLINTTTFGASAPGFASRQTFPTGSHPYSVTAVDINGDSEPDLIVANAYDNDLSVLLNTTPPGASTPSFAAPQTFATGSAPDYVAAADIDHDGKPDLIVANANDNDLSVLLNTTAPAATTPSFAVQQTFATGNSPSSVTTADINGDGRLDLIATNANDNSLSVLINTTTRGATTPSFATQQTFATGSLPGSVTAADIHGDGKPDLIVASFNDNDLSVLLNTTTPDASTPGFANQQMFATGSAPEFVAAADVNRDGKPDLITVNVGDNTVSVLRNMTIPGNATVNFAAQQTFATGSNPYSVAVVDLNGDSEPDLMVANAGDNTVSVMLNATVLGASTPSFAAQQTFTAGSGLGSVTSADINGDGKPDLIVTNGNDNDLSVLLNTTMPGATTPSFAAQQTFATGSLPGSVTAADINGDGKPDLIVANFSDNDLSVLLNTTSPGAATPSFTTQKTFVTDGAGSAPDFVTTADVNVDGKPDLIATNYGSGTFTVLIDTTVPGANNPSFASPSSRGISYNSIPAAVTAADINGDGKPDFFVTDTGELDEFSNYMTFGSDSPSIGAPFNVYKYTGLAGVTNADINGDGKPDVIVANSGSILVGVGNTVSVVLDTTPSGTDPAFPTFSGKTLAVGRAPTSVICADVNGDGKPDLIVTNSHDDDLSVLLNTTTPGATTPGFTAQQTFATGIKPTSLTSADINGDGNPDLIVVNQADNTVSVLLNKQFRTLAAGSPATGTIVHDYIFANGFQ